MLIERGVVQLPLLTLDSDFTVYRRHGRNLIPLICLELPRETPYGAIERFEAWAG